MSTHQHSTFEMSQMTYSHFSTEVDSSIYQKYSPQKLKEQYISNQDSQNA